MSNIWIDEHDTIDLASSWNGLVCCNNTVFVHDLYLVYKNLTTRICTYIITKTVYFIFALKTHKRTKELNECKISSSKELFILSGIALKYNMMYHNKIPIFQRIYPNLIFMHLR